MELKPIGNNLLVAAFLKLSIAPEWNWNDAVSRDNMIPLHYQSHQNGIETTAIRQEASS